MSESTGGGEDETVDITQHQISSQQADCEEFEDTSSFRSRSGRRGRDIDHWFRQSSYIIIFKMATIIYEEERGSLEMR